ncbi:hypothetical protein [Rubritalea squalenifaciens]|uniref:hypothetical protein n=1 Tax=Rubritalea squalenifaciens TaxID=407226 RepID=UPI0011601305|nr:hypothetical protein [Rubritalea squalenifaciens]
MKKRSMNESPDRKLLMQAIENSFKGRDLVRCDVCNQPIVIERDENQQLKRSKCECGKYNSIFRGV